MKILQPSRIVYVTCLIGFLVLVAVEAEVFDPYNPYNWTPDTIFNESNPYTWPPFVFRWPDAPPRPIKVIPVVPPPQPMKVRPPRPRRPVWEDEVDEDDEYSTEMSTEDDYPIIPTKRLPWYRPIVRPPRPIKVRPLWPQWTRRYDFEDDEHSIEMSKENGYPIWPTKRLPWLYGHPIWRKRRPPFGGYRRPPFGGYRRPPYGG